MDGKVNTVSSANYSYGGLHENTELSVTTVYGEDSQAMDNFDTLIDSLKPFTELPSHGKVTLRHPPHNG